MIGGTGRLHKPGREFEEGTSSLSQSSGMQLVGQSPGQGCVRAGLSGRGCGTFLLSQGSPLVLQGELPLEVSLFD